MGDRETLTEIDYWLGLSKNAEQFKPITMLQAIAPPDHEHTIASPQDYFLYSSDLVATSLTLLVTQYHIINCLNNQPLVRTILV